MFKIEAVNNKNGRAFSATFETQEELSIYRDHHISNNSFGLPDRWLLEEVEGFTDTKIVTIEYTLGSLITPEVLDEFGEIVTEAVFDNPIIEESHTEFFYPCDYTIVESDVTAEHDQKLINEQSLKFLSESDYKVLRHRDQLDASLSTSMTEVEFQTLLVERQSAREAIVE